MNILISELHKFSHIRTDIDLKIREFIAERFWDGETWQPIYAPNQNGILIPLQTIGGPISGNYYAKSINREDDIYFPFLNTLWQQGAYKGMIPYIRALDNAVIKLGVLVAQMVQNYYNRKRIPFSTDFITVHVEHFLITVRSIFDFFYECIIELLKRHPSRDKKPNLPEKLSKFILKGGQSADIGNISKKYDLPYDFVELYTHQASFFIQIRKLRDRIIHGSRQNLQTIFEMPKGYGFSKSQVPFSEFHEIKNKQVDGNIASLIPLLGHIIKVIFQSCNRLIELLFKKYNFLPEISPQNLLISRQPYNYYIKIFLEDTGHPPIWFEDIISLKKLNVKFKIDQPS